MSLSEPTRNLALEIVRVTDFGIDRESAVWPRVRVATLSRFSRVHPDGDLVEWFAAAIDDDSFNSPGARHLDDKVLELLPRSHLDDSLR